MLRTISDPVTPADLDRYAGLWVAIRLAEVVASAASLEQLLKDPRYVRETDSVYPVPPPGERIIRTSPA